MLDSYEKSKIRNLKSNIDMHPIQMVDLKRQYHKIKAEVDEAVLNVIESTAFINGKPVQEFANNLSAYLGVKHVIPCANGTDAVSYTHLRAHVTGRNLVCRLLLEKK